nr:hypothetical protein [Tanacetum cinerariifolium]
DRVFKIKDALGNKQYKPEDIQELFRELLNDVQHIHEELAEYINTPSWNRPVFYNNDDDDDEDCTIAITPDFLITDSLSMGDEPLDTIPATESEKFIKSSVENHVPIPITPSEPVDSLSMGDEHLDTIPATKSDQLIKSCVETLIPILSESEGIPEHVCDVPSHDNSPPPDVSKDTIEDLSESNKEFSSTDDDSFSLDNIDYVEASPPDSELVSSEVMEIVILEVSTDNPIPFHDPIIFGTPLNLTPSGESEFFSETKSSSTSLNSLLEETRTFDNSLPEVTTFSNDPCDAECESNDQSYSDEDVLEKIVFDEFVGELTLLKSIPPGIDETDCHPEEEIQFVSANSNADIKSFSPSPIPIKDSDSHMEEIDLSLNPVEPNSRDFTKDMVEDISPTKEPQVLNTLPTHPTRQLNMKFQPSSESLFAYVVWIFLPFLV